MLIKCFKFPGCKISEKSNYKMELIITYLTGYYKYLTSYIFEAFRLGAWYIEMDRIGLLWFLLTHYKIIQKTNLRSNFYSDPDEVLKVTLWTYHLKVMEPKINQS